MSLNRDAQPRNRTFNAARLNDRKIDELIGLCKGVLADGAVSKGEAEFLQSWISTNREVADHWPANILYSRIQHMLEDDILSQSEEKELLKTLLELTGGPTLEASVGSMSSGLPLCRPAPEIDFEDRVFCFTGKFVAGSRRQVEGTVIELGADIKKSPTKKTDFLVIGAIGSSDWIHSTHGRKIEKAVELKESGYSISIVSEEHWIRFIPEI